MKYLTTTLITLFFAAYIALALLMIGTVVPFAGYQVRLVATGSMIPTMPIGAAVFVEKAAQYAPGEIITFERPGERIPTTHRIVSDEVQSGVIYYTTKGDANDAPDQLLIAQPDVIGRVFLSVPYLGYILDFVRKPLGFMLLIGVPFLAVLIEEWRKMSASSRRLKEVPPQDTEPL